MDDKMDKLIEPIGDLKVIIDKINEIIDKLNEEKT